MATLYLHQYLLNLLFRNFIYRDDISESGKAFSTFNQYMYGIYKGIANSKSSLVMVPVKLKIKVA